MSGSSSRLKGGFEGESQLPFQNKTFAKGNLIGYLLQVHPDNP